MFGSQPKKPTAPSVLSRYNERRVLQVVRRMGEASKADLARQTNLTNTAVGSIVSTLHQKHLLRISGKRHDGQRGQPATLYKLEPEGAFSIGVRVDRIFIQTILIDFEGNAISRLSREMILPKPEVALKIILDDVYNLLDTLSETQRCRLSGIGLAQPYNLENWLAELSLPHEDFSSWKTFNLVGHIEDATSIPVCFENDVTAASIAELFYGVGREIDDFIYVFMGPGIGGAVVSGGESIRGPMGNAGDLGLMPVPPSRLPSAPKPKSEWDILLNRASVNTLIRHLKACGHEIHSFSDVNELVDRQDAAVDEWLEDCVTALTPIIWSAVALLDSPVVVFGSDLSSVFISEVINRLAEKLEETAPEARKPPRLMPDSFGSDAEAMGAANLPFFHHFSTQNHSV